MLASLRPLLPLTFRRLLLALALIAVGVLIGLPIARIAQPSPAEIAARGEVEATLPAAVAPEPVQIGPDEEDELTPATTEIPELRTLNRLFTSVAERATGAVVYIEVDGADAEVDPFYGARTTAGSGVIISPAGYVLTNAHVLDGGRRVTVVLNDKREYAAEVVGRDPTTDLAVLRLLEVGVGAEAPLPVATLGDSDDLMVGEWVLAVGSPFRLSGTVTQGIVSALGRSVGAIQNEVFIEDFIQTDAPINQGNSGGALVNLDGEVIGIVTAIATDDQGGVGQGYGFAAPSNLARRVAEDLIEYGEVRRGYVGIQVGEMTAADARERGMDRIAGVLVSDVYEGGPGGRAGLRPGDVLLEVNGVAVDATNRFQSRVALAQPADRLGLTIWRDGERMVLESSLVGYDDPGLQRWIAGGAPSAMPESPATAPQDVPRAQATDWGVRFRDLTPEERRTFGVASGAFIESIERGSAADVDGLPDGTVVLEVEGTAVSSASEAQTVLARLALRDSPALLRVRRPDGLTAFYDLLSPYVD